MHKKDYKGRCEKKTLTKSKEICRTYDPIQNKYADLLEESSKIKEIRCNVLLDNFSEGEYTSDFVCVKSNGDSMVRECIQRDKLSKPMNVKLMNASTEIKQIKENTLLGELMNKNTKICYLIAGGKSIWERLSKRGDDPDEVKRRMERDQEDFKNISEYVDFSIRNEDINPKSLAKIIYGIYQQL